MISVKTRINAILDRSRRSVVKLEKLHQFVWILAVSRYQNLISIRLSDLFKIHVGVLITNNIISVWWTITIEVVYFAPPNILALIVLPLFI